MTSDLRQLRRAVEIHKSGRFVEAAGFYARLFDRNPTNHIGDSCVYFSALLAYQLRGIDPESFPSERAVDLAERAVRRRPQLPILWYNLGCMYQECGRAREAEQAYLRALELDPDMIESRTNLGNAYLDLGLPMRARWNHEIAIAAAPASKDARYNRSLALLLMGEHAEGWREYESRWSMEMWLAEHARPELSGPRWEGQPLPGRLLVHCEQGHGDTMMAARWVPWARARVGALTLQVQPGLGNLMRGQFEGVDVVEFGAELPPSEAWISTMSLPHVAGVRTDADIPPAPYLRALEPAPDLSGFRRVGIVWAGTAKHRNDARRSTRLGDWAPVLAVPGVDFYSLQVGERAAELAAAPQVQNLAPELRDWTRTAAVLTQLDLLITVDTGIAHLAGGLGVPVWICIAAAPDFRWQLSRPDTPWYGSARLFRQTRVGDWAGVMAQVAAALREYPC